METLYRKVEIKSEQDLPKEDKRYYFHLKGNFDLTSCLIPSAKYNQIKKRIDWYFQPIEPQEERIPNVGKTIKVKPDEERQTAEEIKSEIKRMIQCCFESDIESWSYKFLQSHIDGTYEDIMNEINAQSQQPKCEECPSKQFYEANTAKIMDKIEQPEISVTDEEIDLCAREYGELTEGNKNGELTFAFREGAKWRDKLKANG